MLCTFSVTVLNVLLRDIFWSLLNVTCLFSIEDCSGSVHRFEKYHDLPTRGARAVEQFRINGNLFLAFANFYSETEGYKTYSFIYKLNDFEKFYLYQKIRTIGTRDIEYSTIADKHYLAVASRYNEASHQLNSSIYQWNGHQFVAFQSIPTNGATSFNFFKYYNWCRFPKHSNKWSNRFLFFLNTTGTVSRRYEL